MTVESLYQELQLLLDSSSPWCCEVECGNCGQLSICVLPKCIYGQFCNLLMRSLVLLGFEGWCMGSEQQGCGEIKDHSSVIPFGSVLKWFKPPWRSAKLMHFKPHWYVEKLSVPVA